MSVSLPSYLNWRLHSFRASGASNLFSHETLWSIVGRIIWDESDLDKFETLQRNVALVASLMEKGIPLRWSARPNQF